MSVRAGARLLVMLLSVTPVTSLVCAVSCSAYTTQVSAHECHGAPSAGVQVSAGDSCGDHPAPAAILTKTSRQGQTQLTSAVVDALTWSQHDRLSSVFLPGSDTGPPFHVRPVTGLRI
jgi:hypothetical protein